MKVPVLIIVFNRLETVKQVFSQIKAYQPEKFYIASDGARSTCVGEDEKVNEVREYILKNIDWDCKVETLFGEVNIGCKYGPQNAISWFFENEENGIILEDDCLPSEDFFPYCEELLKKYDNDFRVFGITGTNFHSNQPISDSYYFSSYFFTWGWASWRSRWEKHMQMQDSFHLHLKDAGNRKLIDNKYAQTSLIKNAIASYEDEIDAWDYLWILSCVIQDGLIVTPKKNLVKNIGFGDDATHTAGNLKNQREHELINFPLDHPTTIHVNNKMDNLLFKNVLYWISPLDKISNFGYMLAYKKAFLKRVKLRLN